MTKFIFTLAAAAVLLPTLAGAQVFAIQGRTDPPTPGPQTFVAVEGRNTAADDDDGTFCGNGTIAYIFETDENGNEVPIEYFCVYD